MQLKEVTEEDLAHNKKSSMMEQALATNIAAILEARRRELNKGESSGGEELDSSGSSDGFD